MQDQEQTIQTIQTRPKFKFLRRVLVLNDGDEIVLKKIRMKRIFLKDIHELEKGEDEDPYDLNKHRYIKGKLMWGLKSVQLSTAKNLYWFNQLKHAKNIQIFNIGIGKQDFKHVKGFRNMYAIIQSLLQCFRKFSKQIKWTRLYLEGLSVKKKQLKQVYQILSTWRNIEYYAKLFGFFRPESYVAEEFRLINQYLPRLKKLTEFDYDFWRYEKDSWANDEMVDLGEDTVIDLRDFQALARSGVPCPWITILTVNLVAEFFRTYASLEGDAQVEVSDKSDDGKDGWEDDDKEDEDEEDEEFTDDNEGEDDEGEDEEDTVSNRSHQSGDDIVNPYENEERIQFENEEEKKIKMREEVEPFFKFHLFPNTERLNLQLFEDFFYPLEPFVADAFASLTKLRLLELIIEARPLGTRFIFEGLLRLPLLESFSLEIPFMKDDDFELLTQFLDKQVDLVSLTLNISEMRSSKTGFTNQNKYMSSLNPFLQNKPKLQYLRLLSPGCSLESVSQALENTNIVNQLKLLSITGVDSPLSPLKPEERVKGICELLRKQSESLIYLTLDIPILSDAKTMEQITQAISEISGLKEMNLSINYKGFDSDYFFKIMLKEKTNPLKTQNKTKPKGSIYYFIKEMLLKLKKLDDVTFDFGNIPENHFHSIEEFMQLIETLSTLPDLDYAEFDLPLTSISKKNMQRVKDALLNLTHVTGVIVNLESLKNEAFVDEIEDVIDHVVLRQALRCDTMF